VRKDLWGYAPTRRCRTSADRREVPRHPPGARLPGLPGPQRQARPVRAAAAAGDRHGADDSMAMAPARA
jgi:hypothetical protein